MREIFADFGTGGGDSAIRRARAHSSIQQRLDSQQWVDRIHDTALSALTMPTPSPLRTAWVTTWHVPCGVAEYSRFLLETFVVSDVSPPVILCDDRTPASDDTLSVRPAWRLAEPGRMERLARAVAAEDPHVLLIQHQPGLIEWSGLASLLKDRRVRDRITVVTLHAAARLLDIDEPERAAIVADLSLASRLLVHQVADLNILKDLGLNENVTLFPHGTPSRFMAPPARRLPSDSTAVIGCYGFFLPGKGIPRLIEATARLRQQWPNLRLHLANAEYPSELSRMEIDRCRQLANSLGLDDAVEWDTSFRSHGESMEILAKCDLLVLPYDESKESSSAALRSAMASGVPVAVTPAAIFQEAGSTVHRFDGFDIESTIAGIDQLLRDQAARISHQLAASAWLEERSWAVQGQRLRNMLFGLRASSTNFR
jgi:glycosyltransferase involved in cell wall biosynthesis